jgi:hypothetical protein
MDARPAPRLVDRVLARLTAPVDHASVLAFRIVFGALMTIAVIRFFAHGWIREYYLTPKVFFPYWGLEMIRPWPGIGMYVHFAVMGLAAVALTVGLRPRIAAAVFFLTFTWAHLIDRTNYLNHYYEISIVSLLLVFMPLPRLGSPSRTVPTWVVWALRFQFGLVYFFGGVAKLKPDWLLDAAPLRFWLSTNVDFPLLGRFFDEPWVPYAFSFAGAAYDLTVPFFLLWRRSRPFAYAAVIAFHLITARLFQIGMFPWVMIGATLIFFPPDWPRRLFRRAAPAIDTAAPAPAPSTWAKVGFALLGVHCLVQVALPFRHHLYGGNVYWHEQGYRFAWNVMLMEKTGVADFWVLDKKTGRRAMVDLHEHLTPYQIKMMSSQPDMIVYFARWLREREERAGRDVAVYVDAFASLNGRKPERLIDPTVDLSREHDGLAPKRWVLPYPQVASAASSASSAASAAGR